MKNLIYNKKKGANSESQGECIYIMKVIHDISIMILKK